MSNHATVIETHPIWWIPVALLRLEWPDGKRVSVPEGMTAKPGDVVAIVTAAEFELILSERNKVGDENDKR